MLLYTIAVVPLAIYLLLIGCLHLRTQPLVTSGWRDMLTLGIGCLGMVAVGPMQLFFPMHAAAVIPIMSWILMLCLYLMALILFLLWSRPRLTVYGMASEQFRDALYQAAQSIDGQANWNGQVLSLPQIGLQLVVEPSSSRRVHSVAAVGNVHENVPAWHALEREVVRAGRKLSVSPARSGWVLLGISAILLLVSLAPVVVHPETALAELKSFLWR